jgi:ABC-type arginine transport system ATPase subunit
MLSLDSIIISTELNKFMHSKSSRDIEHYHKNQGMIFDTYVLSSSMRLSNQMIPLRH